MSENPKRPAPLIVLHDVHLQYGSTEVLAGVDLEVTRGEKLVLIGKSGSGKSSILRLLMALEAPSAGRIEIGGLALWTTPSGARADEAHLRRMRARMGIVFQQFNLFPHLRALRNVTLGLELVKKLSRQRAEAIARDCLAQVGLADRADAFPAQLSGGQKQRVAIARAIAMEPEILLLDEVTSGLDPELVHEVLATIQQLSAGDRTLIIVTPQMDFARRVATRVVELEAGRVARSGSPDAMLSASPAPRCFG
jgi:polar amino acid transport system ATP-binding protein